MPYLGIRLYIQTVSFTTVNIADCKSICRIFGDCKSFYDLVSHKCYLFERKSSNQHSIRPWIKMITSKLGPAKRVWSERKDILQHSSYSIYNSKYIREGKE